MLALCVSLRHGVCPKSADFVEKFSQMTVWSGGKKTDGNYPLMSTAISKGLYHPRCLDGHSTYFPDVSTPPKPYTEEEKQDLLEDYRTDSMHNARWSDLIGCLSIY